MRHVLGLTIATFVAAWTATAQVPVSGGEGATLSQIAGTDTRVTVVLKDAQTVANASGESLRVTKGFSDSVAEIPNLRIARLQKDHIVTLSEQGVESYYPITMVSEVRVQGGVVAVEKRDVLGDRSLSEDESKALQEAIDKARELFRTAQGNQGIRMDAAVLLMVAGEEDEKTTAEGYLRQLLSSNDIETEALAAISLYRAGIPEPAKELALEAINNRDRSVRALGAVLAGISRNEGAELQLNRMVRDRSADVSAPAAWALGRIKDTQSLPTILNMLTDRNEVKAEAAIAALVELGDEGLVEGLKAELERSEGLSRFRVARVLHALGDEVGTNIIRNEFLESQAVPIRHDAALILAKEGDLKALQVLRQDLRARYDPSPEVLLRRAQAVNALVEAGDRTYMGAYQELLGQSNQFESGNQSVQLMNQFGEIAVLSVIAQSGDRSLLTTVSPSISNHQPLVAITACSAAIAIANDEFRTRINSIFNPETT